MSTPALLACSLNIIIPGPDRSPVARTCSLMSKELPNSGKYLLMISATFKLG